MLTNYNDQIKENQIEGKEYLGYTLRLLPQKRRFWEHGHVQDREKDTTMGREESTCGVVPAGATQPQKRAYEYWPMLDRQPTGSCPLLFCL